MADPTTSSFEAQNDERDKLRVEVARLERALAALEAVGTSSMEEQNDKLRAEVARLERALVTARTNVELIGRLDRRLKALESTDPTATIARFEQQILTMTPDDLTKLHETLERVGTAMVELDKAMFDNAMFVKGYDQAVREIRDHFKKARQDEVVSEIEKIWIKGPSS